MKNTYVKPMMQVEEFLANQYVAACGDSGTVYKFNCNAGDKSTYYGIWIENGKRANLQTTGNNKDTQLYSDGSYHPCGEKHEASSKSDFLNGYIVHDYNYSTNKYTTVIPVIVWRGKNNNNGHCTTDLDINNWETAKS